MLRQPQKPETLVILCSAWIAVVCNTGFWAVVLSAEPAGSLPRFAFVALIGMVATGLVSLVTLLIAIGPLTRVVLSILLIVAATVGYFTASLGVLFDSGMLVNVIETNPAEAGELLSLPLFASIVFAGLLPAVVIWRIRLPRRRLSRALLDRVLAIGIALALILVPLTVAQKEIYSLGRNHLEIRHMLAPVNVLSASYRVARDRLNAQTEYQSIAPDAIVAAPDADRPSVHVLIVGETARSANFSIAGYARDTNPNLEARPDIGFFDVSACGTATAVSLPCMLTIQPRKGFDRASSYHQDNLLDVAARAGYDVQWVDNGNGCKKLCERVGSENVHESHVDALCSDDGCFDGILVYELDKRLADVTGNTFIVLHQLGSHGPAYYRRYPDDYRVFVPDCRSPNLGDCSNEEIANSYDNTILYTDHVIDSAIDVLAHYSDRFDTSLLYISDHGESLGEHNLYLHGMPYKLAPDEQVRVPMITWFGPAAGTGATAPAGCQDAASDGALSHDNLFHTELGLLGIATTAYLPELDAFAACRTAGQMAARQGIEAGD